MSRAGRLVAVSIAGLLVFAAVSPAQVADEASWNTPPAHHKPHNQKKAPAPLVLPPLPPGPLQQVPMDKMPATAPQVTYENGQLKIVAENATLGSILKGVRRLTGASIDLPPNGAPERVVTNIGPGAPRDILALLLNGTQFNYVMLGSSSDPAAVSSVLLSPRPSATDLQTVANTAYQQNPQAPNPMMAPPIFRQHLLGQQRADDSTDDADNADDKTDDSDPNQQVLPGHAEGAPSDPNTNPGDQANQLGMSQRPGQPGPLNPPPNARPPDR